MNLAVCVIGDGRGEFLRQTVDSIGTHVFYKDLRGVMVDDSGDLDYGLYLDEEYYGWSIVHGGRRGMAGAVQAGFDAVLATDAEYVLWVEEDMMLTRYLPIPEALAALEAHPNLAQMCFKREAIDPSEGDDQLAAILARAAFSRTHEAFTTHDVIFSMNPCLIPRRVLEVGWPAGPIGVGNEDGMTRKLLDEGFVFGSWGHVGDEPWARHIGYAVRSSGYRL